MNVQTVITSSFSKVLWSPINVVADINNTCNLNCIMCHPQLVKLQDQIWSLEKFKIVLERFKPRSVVLGASGEPLLNRDLKYMTNYSKKKGCKNILSTNGVTLNQNLDWIVKTVDVLKLSLDASTESTYRVIRRNPGFYKILNCVKGLNSPRVRFEFVVMSKNYKEMESFIDLAYFSGAEYVFFRVLNPDGLPQKIVEDLTCVPLLRKEINKAFIRAKILKVKTNLGDLLKNVKYIEKRYRNKPIQDDRRKHVCLLPWVQLYVSVNGECGHCCNLTEMGSVSVGNIFKGDDVWNGEKMRNMRKLFSTRKNYDIFKECSVCEYLSFSRLLLWTRLIPTWVGG